MTNPEKRQGHIDDLRQLIQWLEDHPEVTIPGWLTGEVYQSFPTIEELAVTVRALDKPVEKRQSNLWLQVVRKFGDLEFIAFVPRSTACSPRVVGTTTSVKSVLVSEAVYEDREVTENVIEWDCEPISAH